MSDEISRVEETWAPPLRYGLCARILGIVLCATGCQFVDLIRRSLHEEPSSLEEV